MKKLLLGITILSIFNCGIPSFEYIGGVTVTSSTVSQIKFFIDFDRFPITNRYYLYSRYYIGDDNNKKSSFNDLTIAKTSNDSVKFVENLGFTVVSMLTSNNVDDFKNELNQLPIIHNDSVVINYDSNKSVTLSNINNDFFYLKSNYKDLPHYIGNYSDKFGIEFKNTFITETTVNVEFVVITKGISSNITIGNIESLPIYIGSMELRSN